jgi:hypothetical protein
MDVNDKVTEIVCWSQINFKIEGDKRETGDSSSTVTLPPPTTSFNSLCTPVNSSGPKQETFVQSSEM